MFMYLNLKSKEYLLSYLTYCVLITNKGNSPMNHDNGFGRYGAIMI